MLFRLIRVYSPFDTDTFCVVVLLKKNIINFVNVKAGWKERELVGSYHCISFDEQNHNLV